jgi:hypothetical protein
MATNLERYKGDLARLEAAGNRLLIAMIVEIQPEARKKLSLSPEEIGEPTLPGSKSAIALMKLGCL